MDPSRRKTENSVACLDARSVDQIFAVDDADARGCEIELVLAVDVGHLGALAADEGDSRKPADLGCPLDELRHLLQLEPGRGDVIQHQQRLRARRDHVVDAVGRHVGAAIAESPARSRDDRLRPDRVHRRGEQCPLVERVEAREAPEPLRARRFDRVSQPLDHGLGSREGDPGLGVRLTAHSPSLSRVSATRTARRRAAAGPEAHPRRSAW